MSLGTEYAETWRVLSKRGEIHAAELARVMGVGDTAMCNRLAALERFGLASSRRDGRTRVFRSAGYVGFDYVQPFTPHRSK